MNTNISEEIVSAGGEERVILTCAVVVLCCSGSSLILGHSFAYYFNTTFRTIISGFCAGESVVLQALQGPLDVCAGLTAGALFGLLAALTPHLEDVSILLFTEQKFQSTRILSRLLCLRKRSSLEFTLPYLLTWHFVGRPVGQS